MSWPDLGDGGRILVVDDALDNIRMLHAALKDDYEVIFARSGAEALRLVQEQPPELILLDAMMPELDGFGVCAVLKSSSLTRDIPLIFVTALNQPEDEQRALEAGAVDFITKPFHAAVIVARVKTHLTLKRQSDVLRQLSLTDSLTGIANRRCFDQALEREWRRCERLGTPLALMMIDVDCFKAYNDRYGHQAGDDCLKTVADCLAHCLHRPSDLVARYGGEEFAVLLPEQELEGALVIARRMIDEARGLNIAHDSSPVAPYVTLSIGATAAVPRRDTLPGKLVLDADKELYQAKSAGRDRVHWPAVSTAETAV